MAKGGKYNDEEKRIQPNPDREKPSEKELKGLDIIDDKTPEMKVLEEEEKKQLSAEEAELKALEAELKALEAQQEALKKAKAEKGVELEEFSTENKKAPSIDPEPKVETPAEEPAKESPKEEEKKEEKKEGDPTEVDEDIPTSPRANPEETPEEKKDAEPEKKEEGQSLFDSMF